MNNTKTFSELLGGVATQLPVLLVCLVGIMVALLSWRRAPAASLWTFLAFCLAFFLCILIPVSQQIVLRMMKEGRIVIVNLASKGKLSGQEADAIGGLIINEILATTRALPYGERYPTYLLLDEFQRFKELLHGESEAALLAQALFDYLGWSGIIFRLP